VEGLCSACLLSLGLPRGKAAIEGTPPFEREARAVGGRVGRPRTLSPVDTGVVAPAWAMPVELLRQAARRLRLAALGLGLFCAVSIVLNNLIEAVGWHSYSNMAIKNVLLASMVAISTGMVWFAHSGRLTPARLLSVSLGYEIVVALVISISDHLAPLEGGVPFARISWLCVWIVIFPLVVPASPRWALVAGLASASTWPVGYLVGLALGNAPAAGSTVLLACLSNYFAAALAMFSTIVIRRLQELGCYQLVEKLDHGGMGEIWKARHRMLARPVAVKLIRPELLGLKTPVEAAALVSRFQREAQATAALHSSHTVALHDFGVTPEGAFYYVMELLEGLDLETLVRRFGPVPPERAIYLLAQACDSLAEAHAVGLIHRDVKPANILACHWGLKWDFVKVLDFGLVKATWSMGDDDRLTSEGVLAGTPAYMAPEAVLGEKGLDARVDLYGLGCVAYWLLTGERVFVGRTPVEVLLHHVKTAPVPPSERAGTKVPPSLEALVLSCLAKDPADRPPTAEWLAARLAECDTAGDWTPARAQAWWEVHRAGASRATPEGTRTTTSPTPLGRAIFGGEGP
jgi:serine/threonine-protein kinase